MRGPQRFLMTGCSEPTRAGPWLWGAGRGPASREHSASQKGHCADGGRACEGRGRGLLGRPCPAASGRSVLSRPIPESPGPRESPPRWPLRDMPRLISTSWGHSPRDLSVQPGGGPHGVWDPDLSGGAGMGPRAARERVPEEPAARGAPTWRLGGDSGCTPLREPAAPVHARLSRERAVATGSSYSRPSPSEVSGTSRFPSHAQIQDPRTSFTCGHSTHTPVDTHTRGLPAPRPAQPGSVPAAAAPSPASREWNRLRIPNCHPSNCSPLSCRRPALSRLINCQGRDRLLGPQRRHRPPPGHPPLPCTG